MIILLVLENSEGHSWRPYWICKAIWESNHLYNHSNVFLIAECIGIDVKFSILASRMEEL